MDSQGLLALLNIWFDLKIFIVVALGFYVAFAAVVIKQTELMRKTINLGLNQLITMIAWGHFLVVAVVFLVALIFL